MKNKERERERYIYIYIYIYICSILYIIPFYVIWLEEMVGRSGLEKRFNETARRDAWTKRCIDGAGALWGPSRDELLSRLVLLFKRLV